MSFGTPPHYEATSNFQVGHVEFVPLAVSYHLYFLCISKVSSLLYHGLVGQVHSKEYYLMFTCAFDEMQIFSQHNINRPSEKLSVELYV